MNNQADTIAPRTPLWRSTRYRRVVQAFAYPVFRTLNRPRLQWLAHAAYDFALRMNGIAINFPGRHGLTVGEEGFIAAWLSAPACTQDDVLLDVGANAGAYSRVLRMVAPAARIYAFEPHPRTFAALAGALAHDRGLTLLNMAVSNTPGDIKLYDFASSDGSTQASLDEATLKMFAADVVAHDVRATTIDAFMADRGITKIRLLKIDTEGFDLAVLQGARAALAARAIDAIQFEFIPANIARHVTMRDFYEVLQGYKLHRLCMNGTLAPMGAYNVKWCEIYVTHNLVALPA